MKRLLLVLAASSIALTTPAHSADDYTTALTRHAQSSAREIVSEWISQRSSGRTWNQILRHHIPAMLDSRCGYQALVGLSEIGFTRARAETLPIVGDRLEASFGRLLSRPKAQLFLKDTKVIKGAASDQVMVVLGVTPPQRKDHDLSLLLELSDTGSMVVCDIGSNPSPTSGALYQLGVDLEL